MRARFIWFCLGAIVASAVWIFIIQGGNMALINELLSAR